MRDSDQSSLRASIDSALETPGRLASQIRRTKILVLDNLENEGRFIRECLLSDGFQDISLTSTIADFLSLASQTRPGLLYLIVHSQDCPGMEALRVLAATPELCEVPSITYIDDGLDEMRQHIVRWSSTELYTPPLHRAELISRTRSILSHTARYTELYQQTLRLREDLVSQVSELDTARKEVARCLARAAEMRDDDTGQHIVRVGRYARILGDELGLSFRALENLEAAAQLHDIGKIGIPDHILMKPGKLELWEHRIMQKHCGFGMKILRQMEPPQKEPRQNETRHRETAPLPEVLGRTLPDEVCLVLAESPLLSVAQRVALTHHERWDGSGYPLGLSGNAIPLEGRITAVADVFDALRSKRPYKPSFPIDSCFSIIKQGRGSHFDPDVVDAFLHRRDEIAEAQIELADVC